MRVLLLAYHSTSHTFIALAVVESMGVDAVGSGCYVLHVDHQRVSLLQGQQRSHVAQPLWLYHLRPVGGVRVLLVHRLLVLGADALRTTG